MPAGVVGVVSGGTSLAVVALSAGTAMEYGLVRTGMPVFVNVELDGLRCGSGGLGNQSDISRDALEARARVALHGHERESVILFDLAHHREDGLHRQRIGLDEISLHEGQILAVN